MEAVGIMAAILSAASWAMGTLLFERIGKTMSPEAITFVKGALGLVLMSVIAAVADGFSGIGTREFIYLAISGIIGISLGDTFFFKSLNDLGAKVQVLFFLLGQIVTLVLSFMLLDEVLSVTQYIAAMVLLAGIVTVTWGRQDDHPNKLRGILYGLLSIFCFSFSSIIVKMAIGDVGVASATFYRMFFGTVAMLAAGLTSKKIRVWTAPLKDWRLLRLFLLNVVVITVGGFLLSMLAIKNIPVSLASVLSTMEPVFVLIFAYLLNRDRASGREIIGAAISTAGLILLVLNG